MLYEFEPSHNAVKETKNICFTKKVRMQLITIPDGSKKFCLGCNNLNNYARSGRLKNHGF